MPESVRCRGINPVQPGFDAFVNGMHGVGIVLRTPAPLPVTTAHGPCTNSTSAVPVPLSIPPETPADVGLVRRAGLPYQVSLFAAQPQTEKPDKAARRALQGRHRPGFREGSKAAQGRRKWNWCMGHGRW